ncbi:MAG: glutamine synthetase family protein [Lachnospiraceae bacterium]|jgi:glutamine synthetase|nr:glutamine synthetase family protein [Lachnospiraceae bacterium]MDY6335406.1 glutamine synthetase family protein [Lachnospiraceae bacterium]
MKTNEDVMELMEEENVKFIRLAFFDVFGNQKNIAIMPGELPRALKYGISIDASAIHGFSTEEKSDLFLKPDVSTVSIVPWRPVDGRVVRMFCDICYPDGRPYEKDTRYMLKQAVKAAAEKKVSVNFGPELEFYVFRKDENGNRTTEPIDHAGYMDCEPMDRGDNIRREICFTLIDMGITPEASHHEQGPGQNEIDFRYSDAMTTADNTSTFKWAVRSICESNGLSADFSPKPLKDAPGNGMHINMSVECEDGVDRSPAFMAGIMKYIRDITLFLDPREESYSRLGRQKAPEYVSWSEQNRSQLIRIPASEEERRRIELRSPDPSCNPYLAYTLLIYAGLSGIEENLEPAPSLDMNLFTADAAVTDGLARLPETLQAAAAVAERSEFVRKYVPEDIIRLYGKR